MLTVDQWRLVIDIATRGSLTRTAATRNVAQAAISKQLATIERQTGVQLFVRHGRGVTISEPGRLLCERAARWVEEAEQIDQELRSNTASPHGIARIGVPGALNGWFVRHVYGDISRRYPNLSLKVIEGNSGKLHEWLESGLVDVAIISRFDNWVTPDDIPLCQVRYLLVGRKGANAVAGAKTSFTSLARLPLVLPASPSPFRSMIQLASRRAGIELKVRLECDSLSMQKCAVHEAGLFTILSDQAVAEDVRTGLLRASLIVTPSLVGQMSIRFSPNRNISKASRLICERIKLIAAATLSQAHPAEQTTT